MQARNPFFLRFIEWAFNRNLPLPVPPQFRPPAGRDLAVVLADWRTTRATLTQALERVERPDEVILVHPMFGPIGAAQVIELLETHQRYHQAQLDRHR
jgi:hypothetical protein